MANRLVSPSKFLNLRCFVRTLHSSPSSITDVSPLNLAEKPEETTLLSPTFATGATSSTSTIDLHDVKGLFSSMSTAKLLRSSVNLHLATLEPMVDVGMWDVEEACWTARTIWNSAGLRGMLVYALEHTTDNATSDRNLEGFIRTVEGAKRLPPSSVSFVIAKMTAICSIDLLKRVSDLLRWQHRDPSFHLPWRQNCFPIFADSSPFYHTLERPDPLTPQEEKDLQLALQRLFKLCQKCVEANLPLSVDAEYTSVQPAIDYLTYSAAIQYNKDKNNPIVYGTIQAYLKDAKERLLLAVQAADKMGVPIGFKLVRGAYIPSETQLASSLGYDSPVHNSIEETHACFNGCASFLLERIAGGSGAVVLATHNLESGKLLATKARDLGISKEDHKVQFAQLYGMSESLSFGLRNAGFQVSKYMAFGPVEKVMPYLLRRAERTEDSYLLQLLTDTS
ncbi:Proline dehydrogenase 2, mitochondrial [Vitis vinifera]|uniref:Proline dehydrogenase n=1 Tax=Vitis vinifera TaxID=29760 RepID=A0A438EA71_VITVI|nr:Proline dehydrogenase 2, mitochondrial [Vitis vinifera]